MLSKYANVAPAVLAASRALRSIVGNCLSQSSVFAGRPAVKYTMSLPSTAAVVWVASRRSARCSASVSFTLRGLRLTSRRSRVCVRFSSRASSIAICPFAPSIVCILRDPSGLCRPR